MTIRQAYDLYRTLIDEGSDAFLKPADFVRQYARSRRAWLKVKAQEAETEYVKRLLSAFRKPPFVTTENISQGIAIASLGNGVYIRAVRCDFLSAGFRLLDKATKPLTDDEYGVVMADPTKRPDDWFPRYREEGGKVLIKSSTMPTRVVIDLVGDLPTPVLNQNEASDLAEDDRAVDEILSRIAAGQDLAEGNFSRYNLTAGRETPVREVNN